MSKIKLTSEAEQVIEALRHPAGTFGIYRNTLTRIFNQVLHTAEDLGMDDLEAIETLRALDMIRRDLAALATTPAHTDDDPEDVAARVEAIFEVAEESDDIQDSNYQPGDKLDEPREMLKDIGVAYQRTKHLQGVISEAITHATRAGDKYRCVISDLADINGDLEIVSAQIDALMAINPDTFEPKELTNADHTTRNVINAIDAITAAKEYLDDALDYARRSDALDKVILRRIETTREQVIRAASEASELSVRANNAKK